MDSFWCCPTSNYLLCHKAKDDPTCFHKVIFVQIHAHIHTYTNTYIIHTYILTLYIHTYIHTYIRTYIHTKTHRQGLLLGQRYRHQHVPYSRPLRLCSRFTRRRSQRSYRNRPSRLACVYTYYPPTCSNPQIRSLVTLCRWSSFRWCLRRDEVLPSHSHHHYCCCCC